MADLQGNADMILTRTESVSINGAARPVGNGQLHRKQQAAISGGLLFS